jgi:hypothetical protein
MLQPTANVFQHIINYKASSKLETMRKHTVG